MATLSYVKQLSTTSSAYTYTPRTGDVTGYKVDITISNNKNQTAKFQQSTNGTTWSDISGYAAVDVENESWPITVRSATYVRVGIINDVGGETDTPTVTIEAESESATYCTADDVRRVMQLRETDGTVMTLSASTNPTSTDVVAHIIEAEDEVDRYTHHAWRTRRVTEEYHDFLFPRYLHPSTYSTDERTIFLHHQNVNTLVADSDKIEIWDGTAWDDIVTDGTESRSGTYWLDYTKGIIFFVSTFPMRKRKSVRVTYDYGESSVPHDIRQATALLAAATLARSDDYSSVIPVGGEGLSISDKADKWEERAYKILARRRHTMVV